MKPIIALYDIISKASTAVKIAEREVVDTKQSQFCDACDVKDAEIELARAQTILLIAERDAMSHTDYDSDELREYLIYNCSCGRCSVCSQSYDDFNRAYD